MNNLQSIIVIAAALSIPLSIWLIVYFGSRIFTSYEIRRHLGDMPSSEEIHQHYQNNNAIIRGYISNDAIARREHENPS